ncbi:right-handed parallel beta-helix repeat-containing protein [Candidatus Bathyarchaeota archaeon]|nr:right-handed parallel beta-helix repeat-containing protein [Candidatus Bathyarchaeota archaeon]
MSERMRKLSTTLTITLLALSMLVALPLVTVRGNGESTTWYVDDDRVEFPGANFTSIQEAIDAASPGDTIIVHAGTYYEFLQIHTDNLTIRSADGAANTIIDVYPMWNGNEGIGIHADGVTFEGFTVRHPTDNPDYEARMVHVEGSNNIIRDNIIIGDLSVWGGEGLQYGIFIDGEEVAAENNIIENNEVYNISYIGIEVFQTHASGNIIRGNNVHHIGFYGIAIDRSPGNMITQNTISDLLGMPGYPAEERCWGIVIWGELADGNIIIDQDMTDSPNGGIVLSSAHNTLVKNCDISGNAGIGLMIAESSWAGGIPEGNNVIGNNIKNNAEGIRIAGTIGLGNEFHFNNIEGNTDFGINNLSPSVVDATKNWWGDSSGPHYPTLNPGGLGDKVSDNVDFDPWLTAPITVASSKTGTNEWLEFPESRVDVYVDGSATVYVATYESNPGAGFMGDIGNYIDVYVPDVSGLTELEIRKYYTDREIEALGLDERGLKLYWWNGTDWVLCSDTGVNTVENYIWARIRADTTPSLSDLTGTPFGAASVLPSVLPVGGAILPVDLTPYVLMLILAAGIAGIILKKTML